MDLHFHFHFDFRFLQIKIQLPCHLLEEMCPRFFQFQPHLHFNYALFQLNCHFPEEYVCSTDMWIRILSVPARHTPSRLAEAVS